MTTIAYRDGVIVADSRASRGGWLNVGAVPKLFRVPDGVCAVCGSLTGAAKLVDWMRAPGGERPTVTGDVTVIHVAASGRITIHEDGGEHEQPGPFMAWGSGGPVALGALYAGADALTAVRIAAKVDPYTGGPIKSMRVAS